MVRVRLASVVIPCCDKVEPVRRTLLW
jgi:hypothetical protein